MRRRPMKHLLRLWLLALELILLVAQLLELESEQDLVPVLVAVVTF